MRTVVVGGGPAGLMASASCAYCGGQTVLIERNEKPGKKLYITGKGRCNVTNACTPREFLEKVVTNPKFLYGALYAFTPEDTVNILESNGTKTKVERGNRVFPLSDKASDVTKAFVKYAQNAGVVFEQGNVTEIVKNGEVFSVVTNEKTYECDNVILACGGVSYPSTGSNGDGFKLAKALGHTVTAIRPALVPIYLKEDVKSLQGLSLKNVSVTVGVGKNSYTQFGEMLFTDKGVSGPVILSASSLINKINYVGTPLCIDLKPALDESTLDKRILSDFDKYKNKRFRNSLDDLLPKSLIPYIIERSGINPDKPVNSVSREERAVLAKLLKCLNFTISALGSVEQGIVTSGGVNVSEVNPKTMESKIVKGLYFAGEMLDVDALTGGFNIQIALSTGYLAGTNAGGNYD
ncbi:MAG: NAD(P)/FAD-dependent oxidoreductase [Clostridia bacterium]|nr:NAD(P)/FAD-dependent oxidoreductase [Clostridia bacterium]